MSSDNKFTCIKMAGSGALGKNTALLQKIAKEKGVILHQDQQEKIEYIDNATIPRENGGYSEVLHKVSIDSDTVWEIPARFKFLKKIGSGAYGCVASFEESRPDNSVGRVALKKIGDLFRDLVDAKRILREIKILKSLRHENMINLLEILDPLGPDFEDIYLVSDLMDTDLHRVIYSRQPLTPEHHQYFLYQILLAVAFLHEADVIHRDLKPSNILVNLNCDIKLCDFGLARGINVSKRQATGQNQKQKVQSHKATNKGTNLTDAFFDWNCNSGGNAYDPELNKPLLGKPDVYDDLELTEYVVTRWYRPPELLLYPFHYSKPVDIWSVGCIFAELLGRRALFAGKDHYDQLRRIVDICGSPSASDIEFLDSVASEQKVKNSARRRTKYNKQFLEKLPKCKGIGFPGIFPQASPLALDLLSKLLTFSPAKRITAMQALRHPYFSGLYSKEDEPKSVKPMNWDFDSFVPNKRLLQNLIYKEILSFHPELINRDYQLLSQRGVQIPVSLVQNSGCILVRKSCNNDQENRSTFCMPHHSIVHKPTTLIQHKKSAGSNLAPKSNDLCAAMHFNTNCSLKSHRLDIQQLSRKSHHVVCNNHAYQSVKRITNERFEKERNTSEVLHSQDSCNRSNTTHLSNACQMNTINSGSFIDTSSLNFDAKSFFQSDSDKSNVFYNSRMSTPESFYKKSNTVLQNGHQCCDIDVSQTSCGKNLVQHVGSSNSEYNAQYNALKEIYNLHQNNTLLSSNRPTVYGSDSLCQRRSMTSGEFPTGSLYSSLNSSYLPGIKAAWHRLNKDNSHTADNSNFTANNYSNNQLNSQNHHSAYLASSPTIQIQGNHHHCETPFSSTITSCIEAPSNTTSTNSSEHQQNFSVQLYSSLHATNDSLSSQSSQFIAHAPINNQASNKVSTISNWPDRIPESGHSTRSSIGDDQHIYENEQVYLQQMVLLKQLKMQQNVNISNSNFPRNHINPYVPQKNISYLNTGQIPSQEQHIYTASDQMAQSFSQ